MNAGFYAGNRKRLFEKLEEGSVAFFHSGLAPIKSNDQEMCPFPVNRNFYYLTGIDEENVWLVMTKTAAGLSEGLFIAQPDPEIIKWTGKMLTREIASQLSGIPEENIYYNQDFDRYVSGRLSGARFLSGVNAVYFSLDRLSLNAAPTVAEQYAAMLREKYPALQIKNSAQLMASLRAVKAPEEVDCIRRAIDVTIDALKTMLKSAKPGEYEYQWAADFEHYVARAGMQLGFTTIAASGENAVMLHYSDNNCVVKEGGMFLFDLGAEYKYYSADISRTFPVSGKFTPRQKELFQIVREAMDVARDKMRPGVALRESQQAVIDFYKKALRSAKLIKDDSEVSKYYYHGVSHSLGLDTHDPCERAVYEPGMVITCEPGLYVAEEGIGIRLENDVLVTENGPEDLVGTRLLDIGEIEEIMAR